MIVTQKIHAFSFLPGFYFLMILTVILGTGCTSIGVRDNHQSLVLVDLRCEYRVDPIDIEAANPRLGWKIETRERGFRQKAYRILVSSSPAKLDADKGDLWDSGRVESDESAQAPYNGAALESGMRCWWKVRVWDNKGQPSQWSAPARWEMGLLHPSDWKARWIGHACKTAPLFRSEFKVNRDVASARAYICGLGYYELYLNGKKVGDSILDPGETDYEEREFYVVYDVTDNLKRGENAVGVMLGDGWYNQRAVNEKKYGWGDVVYGAPRLIFQMRIDYTNGTHELVVSDGRWRASTGPVLSSNVYAGETFDARLEKYGWAAPGFDDKDWAQAALVKGPGGVLESQKIPPVRRMAAIKPVALTNPKQGVYIFDMGQNFAGWARLKVAADPGTEIKMRFAEDVSDNGMIDMESTGVSAIHVEQTDRYICRGGGVEIWEPRFTYHGFRYVEMTGFPGKPSLDMLEGIVVYTAVERTGTFACSDSLLNRIHKTALWTLTSNLHSVPTDCPAREKCGWLGDAHVSAEMSIFNFDMPVFWTKYVRDIETNRRSRGGIVEDVAPGRRQEPGTHPDWGSAFIQIPWYLYLYYGDTAVLREHYNGMREFLSSVEGIAESLIVSAGYGDWCPPGGARPTETPVALTSTAYFYFDASLMARIAELLGKKDDSVYYRGLSDRIRAAFIAKFYNPAHKSFGSQTADAFTLYLGLVPPGDENAVAASLADNVVRVKKGHLATGVTGSLHLYRELSSHGYGDAALGILRKTDYPSIGYLFSLGATTLWEQWQKRGGSLNHPMQGCFDVWFYDSVGGINPDPAAPGFKHTIFRPLVVGGLESAKAGYRSQYGTISSAWTFRDGMFTWRIAVPANTTATVHVPSDDPGTVTESGAPVSKAEGMKVQGMERGCLVLEVGSGTYEFATKVDPVKWEKAQGKK
jgi:alpha-L-rhamnosidase